MRFAFVVAALLSLAYGTPAAAATSTRTGPSPMAGNGHNVSFDGRLFIARRGPDSATGGWFAQIFRPEGVTYAENGDPQMMGGAFSPSTLIQPFAAGENALAICEADPDQTPFFCDEQGNATGAGPYACYDVWILDSNAYPMQVNDLKRRRLKLWVVDPFTADARVHKHEWLSVREALSGNEGPLMGIEPTVTRDGHLLVWQGHYENDGRIDQIMYATNDDPCAGGGWDGPHPVAHMINDPRVNGVYALGDQPLRAADGTLFADDVEYLGGLYVEEADALHGGYPWLFPDGDALIFTSVVVPCISENNPAGCGPRRGGLSVLGYPTRWGVAHIDGSVNPDTDQTVRLFFSSPGPTTFDTVPVTDGIDVWPFFGSNTQNYTEIVFDDGLDGHYGAVWLMNESVTLGGDLDRSRTPDTSGWFNTGSVVGGIFPPANNTPTGKGIVFNGTSAWVHVPHHESLSPVNALTLEARVRLDAGLDCDGNNNYRVLLTKGGINQGAYTLIVEESGLLHGRVQVGGEQRSLVSTVGLAVGQWQEVALSFHGPSGHLAWHVDGAPAGEAWGEPGVLDATTDDLYIGGPGSNRAACPNGDGALPATIDDVRLSRVDRYLVDFDDASVSASAPAASVPPGGAFEMSVQVHNTGTLTWTHDEGYRLATQQQPGDVFENVEVPLLTPVAGGGSTTLTAALLAPAQVGSYELRWQMQRDGEAFGAVSAAVEVVVEEMSGDGDGDGGDGMVDPGDGDGDGMVDPGDGDGDGMVDPGDGDGDGMVDPGDGDGSVDPGDGDGVIDPGDGDGSTSPGPEPDAAVGGPGPDLGGCRCVGSSSTPPLWLMLLPLVGLLRRRR